MNYQQTVSYLYSRLPMFSRTGASAIKKDLTNTIELCRRLNNPQNQFRSVHVGGTNGKGSTSHMLAAILQTAGYKTGLYTSPHLLDFRERIRINGTMIPREEVINFVAQQQSTIEEIEPSFFELTVAMAFDYFAKQEVDVAVIEVGLGGRLDSTNIIDPLVSVITNISFDHMDILGSTLKEIAGEKAGIMKKETPVVIGEKQNEVAGIFIEKAKNLNSAIVFADELFKPDSIEYPGPANDYLQVIIQGERYELDLTGSYQAKNLLTVLAAVSELGKQYFIITDEHLRSAFKQVKKMTGLAGRWQTISQNPLVICDTGHNEDGIREVLKNIAATPHRDLHMVIGMVKDKEVDKIFGMLPVSATYYFCQPDIARARPVNELKTEAFNYGLKGKAFNSVKEALNSAKANAEINDLIFVGGSTFVVAEVL